MNNDEDTRIGPHRRYGRRPGSFYLRGITADLKDAFKGYCGKRGYTMREALAYLMRDAVQRDRRLPIQHDE